MNDTTIGPYEVRGEVGSGGMAEVYRAVDPQTGLDVAVKLMAGQLTRDVQFIKRFQREGDVLRRLRHTSIVGVIDWGEHEGRPYLVIPYLSGGTLADRLDRGPLPPPEILAVLTPIADALDYAHAQGIIHRDVKPSNILFDETGAAYLSDFGIVKVLDEVYPTVAKTRTGVWVGTPEYMSPEQVGGSESLDGRCDVYALGVVLFEMLTGRVPFVNTNPVVVAVKQANEPPPRLSDVAPTLAREWQPILDRALAKSPEARYPTATALVTAARAAAAVRPGQNVSRRVAAGPLAFLSLLVLLLGGALWPSFSNSPAESAQIDNLPTSAAPTEQPVQATSTAAPTSMIIPVVAPVLSPIPVGPPRLRLNNAATLRAGPGAIYDALTELAAGVEATILGRDHVWAWYNILLDNGRRGWLPGVAFQLLDPAVQADIEPAATIPAPPVTATPTATATTPPTFAPLPAVQAPTAALPTAVVAPPTSVPPEPEPPEPEPPEPEPPEPEPPEPEPPEPEPPKPECPYPPPSYPPPGC